MRFTLKPILPAGSTRIRKAFLFFPRKIGREVRWLEQATWTEKKSRRTYMWYPLHWEETRDEPRT